jgi:hypothetical protein
VSEDVGPRLVLMFDGLETVTLAVVAVVSAMEETPEGLVLAEALVVSMIVGDGSAALDEGKANMLVEALSASVTDAVVLLEEEVEDLVMVICDKGPPGTVHGIGVGMVSGGGGLVGITPSVVVSVTVINDVQIGTGIGIRRCSSTRRIFCLVEPLFNSVIAGRLLGRTAIKNSKLQGSRMLQSSFRPFCHQRSNGRREG